MTGGAQLLSTWTKRMRRRGMPRARAAVTKRDPSASMRGGADVARDDDPRGEHEHEHGEHEVVRRVEEDARRKHATAVPARERVRDVAGSREPADRKDVPVRVGAEVDQRHRRDPELGRRVQDEQDALRDAVERAAAARGREQAERDADGEQQQRREQHQQRGRRKPLPQQLGDRRLRADRERVPEVEADEVAEPRGVARLGELADRGAPDRSARRGTRSRAGATRARRRTAERVVVALLVGEERAPRLALRLRKRRDAGRLVEEVEPHPEDDDVRSQDLGQERGDEAAPRCAQHAGERARDRPASARSPRPFASAFAAAIHAATARLVDGRERLVARASSRRRDRRSRRAGGRARSARRARGRARLRLGVRLRVLDLDHGLREVEQPERDERDAEEARRPGTRAGGRRARRTASPGPVLLPEVAQDEVVVPDAEVVDLHVREALRDPDRSSRFENRNVHGHRLVDPAVDLPPDRRARRRGRT